MSSYIVTLILLKLIVLRTWLFLSISYVRTLYYNHYQCGLYSLYVTYKRHMYVDTFLKFIEVIHTILMSILFITVMVTL